MVNSKTVPDAGATSAQRPVRSYVKRQGRMTSAQRRALDELWPDYGLDYRPAAVQLDAVFGRPAPTVFEIGIGNGENLVAMARNDPDSNFLGVEVHEPGIGHCLLKARELQLSNVRLMRHDAVEVLEFMIPAASLRRVNLFFPDPWHKKRHNKRRIVQPAFVELLASRLEPHGIFHVVTDWENYAEHIDAVMRAAPEFEALAQPPADRLVTRFDNRGQRLGHENRETAWCKCSN